MILQTRKEGDISLCYKAAATEWHVEREEKKTSESRWQYGYIPEQPPKVKKKS